ncbi:hypothetical protein AALC17_17220 [Oscillospiraceae bacterium 38-13]
MGHGTAHARILPGVGTRVGKSNYFPQIAQTFVEWGPTITGVIQSIWEIFQTVATAVMGIIQALMPTIQGLIGTGLETIKTVVGGALTAIQGLLNVFAGIFTGDWSRVWEGVCYRTQETAFRIQGHDQRTGFRRTRQQNRRADMRKKSIRTFRPVEKSSCLLPLSFVRAGGGFRRPRVSFRPEPWKRRAGKLRQ